MGDSVLHFLEAGLELVGERLSLLVGIHFGRCRGLLISTRKDNKANVKLSNFWQSVYHERDELRLRQALTSAEKILSCSEKCLVVTADSTGSGRVA
jgi:hypothetical protein